MPSKASIANVALRRMGTSKLIANVDTERSQEAIAIRDAWDQELELVLRASPWPWATSYATLALVDGSDTEPVNKDWTFAYRYPADCVFLRRLVTNDGRDERADPPAYKIGRDAQGRLVYSNQPEAECEYTVRVTDPAEFDPLFVSLLAWRLVGAVGVALSKLEKIEQTALVMFQRELAWAANTAGNEAQDDNTQRREADWIAGR